jgi:uncharacterized repeat protein (TIGR02543 family)
MQLNKLFARANSLFIASLLMTGTFVLVAVPASAAGTISQGAPTGGATTVDGSSTFSGLLNVSGDTGPVTFVTTSSAEGLVVDANTGAISTTGLLPVGTYVVSGTDSDTSSDDGVWSYSLAVSASTISQVAPTSGTTTVGASSTFADALNVNGNNGAVTYTTTSSASGLTVNSTTGAIATTGLLSAGTHTVSGTDVDVNGDTGSWSYRLSVTGGTLTQSSPTSGTTTIGSSSAFTGQLAVSGNNGAVTYTTTSSASGLTVNSTTGAIASTGLLAVGTHTVSGTDIDVDGDSGTWSYGLSVTGDTLTQSSPTSGTTTVALSSTFTSQLAVSGNNGAVTYTTTSSASGLTVNSTTGAVTTTGPLNAGNDTVSGTDADADGDTGVWAFTLTVTPPGVRDIVQTSPTTGSTTTPDSATFVPPAIAVTDSTGAVTFVTTTASTGLKVTSAGIISVTASLPAGSYTVSGTDKDSNGDVGTWTYSLTVADTFETVTFEANGGTGSMAAETQDQSTSLTINKFKRSSYTFVDWNTSASGADTAYANGATYPFSASLTLYAQWKKGKVAYHEVTFFANGGNGSMAIERENTPTGLTKVNFTRAGYTFLSWNTKAKGTGSALANGVTYSFRSSLSLYAQWKKKPRTPAKPEFTVVFGANGGKGVMQSEKGRTPAALSKVTFTRAGYTFLYWNTKPGGSGAKYANGATFPFAANITLYAQWHHNKVAVPPAVPGSASIDPFARKSSSLTSSLKSQINALAVTVKANHDTKIALIGYGDELSKADQLNESIWAANFLLSRARARAVETYLRTQLAALGVLAVTISAEGNGSSISGTTSSTEPARYAVVTATLT